MTAAWTFEGDSTGMVAALGVLVACWVVIVAALAYSGKAAARLFLPFLEELAPRTFGESLLLLLKVVLHLAGWVLVLVALFRSEWDAGIVDDSFARTAMKALATWPAALAAALVTVVLVVLLPPYRGRRWARIANVFACIALTGAAAGAFFVLAANTRLEGGSIPELIFLLGYGPLMLVSMLFLAAAIGVGFCAGQIHRRAGGIRTFLFATALVSTVLLLERYGPVSLPLPGAEPITTDLVRSELGAWGVASLAAAGLLGAFAPAEEPIDG